MNVVQDKQTADKHVSTLMEAINATASPDIHSITTEPVQVICYLTLMSLKISALLFYFIYFN